MRSERQHCTNPKIPVAPRRDHQPFGEEIPSNIGGRSGLYETQTEIKQQFMGKERDAETGPDYFGARYLSAAQGRFVSPDPFSAVDALGGQAFDDYLGNPQYWNRDSYSLNNPLKYKDSEGGLPHAVVGARLAVALEDESKGQAGECKEAAEREG
jgi:RHS repeat-associated protein